MQARNYAGQQLDARMYFVCSTGGHKEKTIHIPHTSPVFWGIVVVAVIGSLLGALVLMTKRAFR